MVWARFDDGYLDSPKVEAAGPLAEHLDMRAIIYCARNETDGLITRAALTKIGYGLPKLDARVVALIEAGRWTVNPGGGWLIHDFLDYNPSKASLVEKRKKDRERQSKHRAGHGVTNDVTNAWPRSGRVSVDEKREEDQGEKSEPPWVTAGLSWADWNREQLAGGNR